MGTINACKFGVFQLKIIFPCDPVSGFWQEIAGTLKGTWRKFNEFSENLMKGPFYRCVGRV